ncbi:hypothetical protein BH24CHL5_BH24CHL5_05220 [soil metagenome]
MSAPTGAKRSRRTREELLAAHADARRRRDQAELDSAEFRAAAEQIAELEIQMNAFGEPKPALPR